MSCNIYDRFSIDCTVSSLILSTCVLILSTDGFFLLTDFMYVMVSITLSSIISVVIGNKILVASRVENVLMDC